MSADLLKVSKGLKLVFWGLMIVVIAIVLGIVGVSVASVLFAAQGQGPGGAVARGLPLILVMVVVGIVGFAGNIVGLVGRVFCLSTPPEARGAKTRITLSVVFEVCALLNSIVMNLDNLGVNLFPPTVKIVASGFGVLMQIAAVVLFLLFVKSLALFVRRSQLSEDAMSVLYLWVVTFVCYLFGVGVAVAGVAFAGGGGGGAGGGAVGGCIGGILMIVALIFGIIALVKYAKLLTSMSDAVRKFAKVAARERDEADDDEEDEDDPDRKYRRKSRRKDDDEDDLDDDRGTRRRRPRDDD